MPNPAEVKLSFVVAKKLRKIYVFALVIIIIVIIIIIMLIIV